MMRQKYERKVFGGRHFLRVLKGTKLMGVGKNEYGQLGTGDKKNTNEFVQMKLPKGAKILKYNGRWSSSTTIVLTTLGLLGTGNGENGEFGDGTKKNRCKLTPLKFYKDMIVAKYFAEGSALWVFLENGKIIRSGWNYYSQLGNGTRCSILVPLELDLDFLSQKREKIVHLSSENQTALLSDEGRVYVCGYNVYGQLGLSHTRELDSFTKLGFFEGKFVTMVVSGDRHLIFATKDCSIYSCGRNLYGQLGLGDKKARSIPTKIALFGKKVIVEKICAGLNRSVVLTKYQRVFSFGDNSFCQCGMDTSGMGILVPTLVKTNFKPIDIEVTSYSSVFVEKDGSLHTIGFNRNGQCALGHFESSVKKLTRTKVTIEIEGNLRVTAFRLHLLSDLFCRNIVVRCERY